MNGLCWGPAYYVLGNILFCNEIKPKQRIILYCLGELGTVVTICGSIWESVLTNTLTTHWLGYSSVNVLCMAVALFVFAKYELSRIPCKEKCRNMIGVLSKYTFCIYLVHSWVLASFLPQVLKISVYRWDAWMSIPIITFIVFICSLVISAIVNQIPILKRYIA